MYRPYRGHRLNGLQPGTPADTTLFKSEGTGLHNAIVAARMLDAADGAEIGQTIDGFLSIKATPPE